MQGRQIAQLGSDFHAYFVVCNMMTSRVCVATQFVADDKLCKRSRHNLSSPPHFVYKMGRDDSIWRNRRTFHQTITRTVADPGRSQIGRDPSFFPADFCFFAQFLLFSGAASRNLDSPPPLFHRSWIRLCSHKMYMIILRLH